MIDPDTSSLLIISNTMNRPTKMKNLFSRRSNNHGKNSSHERSASYLRESYDDGGPTKIGVGRTLSNASTHSCLSTGSSTSRRHRRRSLRDVNVRFDEGSNEFFDRNIDDSDDEPDLSELWYKKRDVAGFRKEASAKAEAVCMQESIISAATSSNSKNVFSSWTERLETAYDRVSRSRSFSKSNDKGANSLTDFNKKEMDKIFLQKNNKKNNDKGEMPMECVGLDKWVVGGKVYKDKVKLRKEILKAIKAVKQERELNSENQRPLDDSDVDAIAEEIGRASSAISQPSRIYAHYIAVLAGKSSE